jgi:cell division septum initiation protein DivIVA
MSIDIDGTEYACLTINAFLEEENKELKQRIAELEEQLKGCIRPKFKVGQTVYTFNKNTECIYELCIKIIRIEINEISKFNSLVYLAERLEDGNFFGYFEVELFTTKEEAQAKLQELQGES